MGVTTNPKAVRRLLRYSGTGEVVHFGPVGIALRSPASLRRRSDGATSAVNATARKCAESQAAEAGPTSAPKENMELREVEMTEAAWRCTARNSGCHAVGQCSAMNMTFSVRHTSDSAISVGHLFFLRGTCGHVEAIARSRRRCDYESHQRTHRR